MTLQIRDDRARELAQTLARKRKVTMTEAVIQALESELRRETEKEPLASRVARIAADLAAQAKPGGRTMDKEEIDAMWGSLLMFIDTSAIVALLAGEADADHFADRISEAKSRLTSGLVVLEASMRLSTMLNLDPVLVETRVQALIDEAGISVVPINGGIAKKAVAAFAAYGKGRGHPAQLNLADCMSYACAKAYRVPLLFKGNDFSRTDIETVR